MVICTRMRFEELTGWLKVHGAYHAIRKVIALEANPRLSEELLVEMLVENAQVRGLIGQMPFKAIGLYPATDEKNLELFNEWRVAQGR